MVITVTKMVYLKPVLVVQFANGQILLFLLCLDNVAQATIAMLTMNFRVQLDLGLPQDQVYARQSFLDKCGSQQPISLSHVHGDITNHIMQLKPHVRYAQLVLLAVIQLRNPLNAPQALLPLLMGWANVSHALQVFIVIHQVVCHKTALLAHTPPQDGQSVLHAQLGKAALTNKAPLIAPLDITVLQGKTTALPVHQDLSAQLQLTFLLPVLVVLEMLVILKLVKQVTIAVGVKLFVLNVLKALSAQIHQGVRLLFVLKVNGQMQDPYLVILVQRAPHVPIPQQQISYQ